ncbi:MAG: PDZ domain-containing protein [Bacteroidia bacterium]|nr:aspartyl protease family protein [Bacteroidales bacterium]NCD41894.1 PDZ domain-containing protein [Bacteroidia bacterium]MDD2323528.1 aspartyl protease family protein [Bacteroidales bacterium]MDD3010651.1 aspartyl protease family protein [Bacteroidales bacterium]MDD3960982.1 aspartyl protease family protein [Bacteroidales bacterium]
MKGKNVYLIMRNKRHKLLSLTLFLVPLLFTGFLKSESRETEGKYLLPFDLHNNLIIIDVSINKSKPLSFILDSGVSDIIITELGFGDSLELNYAKEIMVKGLGKGDPVKAYYSVMNEVTIGGITSTAQNIRVLMQDMFNLSKRMGRPIHGLIGYSVLKNYIVEIRYAQRRIILYEPDAYKKPKKRRAFTIPMEIEQTKPYIRATVNITSDSTLPVKLFLDTGASHTLWLAEDCIDGICVPPDAVKKYLGAGLNGDITGHMSVIENLYFGGFKFNKMITSFPDKESVQNLFSVNNRNGSIGAEILRRFTITFDYTRKEITFVPNRSLREALYVNRAGFEIEMPVPDFPLYTVAFIEEGSPSWKAGLRTGDQVLKINGENTLFMDFNEIIGFLYMKPGKTIKLEVSREGSNKSFHFQLEEPFTFPPLEVNSVRE